MYTVYIYIYIKFYQLQQMDYELVPLVAHSAYNVTTIFIIQ